MPKKQYEPEFLRLHPQVKHTAQWIFEHLENNKDRDYNIRVAIDRAKAHCKKKHGIV